MAPDPRFTPKEGASPYRTRVTGPVIRRALRSWLYPYIRSLVMAGEFDTLIAYLFSE